MSQRYQTRELFVRWEWYVMTFLHHSRISRVENLRTLPSRSIKMSTHTCDGSGDLKISDFGLASVFKYKGKSRLLTDRCGSPPYGTLFLPPNLSFPSR